MGPAVVVILLPSSQLGTEIVHRDELVGVEELVA
jgi:hypothetical protein